MSAPKQRPGYAKSGEFKCTRKFFDDQGKEVGTCDKDVPEGELPWTALNSLSGHYLKYCRECREEYTRVFKQWTSGSEGVARLLATLHELPDGALVSESVLRNLLVENNERAATSRGPMSKKELGRALKAAAATPPGVRRTRWWSRDAK